MYKARDYTMLIIFIIDQNVIILTILDSLVNIILIRIHILLDSTQHEFSIYAIIKNLKMNVWII